MQCRARACDRSILPRLLYSVPLVGRRAHCCNAVCMDSGRSLHMVIWTHDVQYGQGHDLQPATSAPHGFTNVGLILYQRWYSSTRAESCTAARAPLPRPRTITLHYGLCASICAHARRARASVLPTLVRGCDLCERRLLRPPDFVPSCIIRKQLRTQRHERPRVGGGWATSQGLLVMLLVRTPVA